jgi:hypothetical protein
VTQSGWRSLSKFLALSSLFGFLILAGSAGCSDSGKVLGNGDDDTTTSDTVSFADVVLPMLIANCTGSACHIGSLNPPKQLSLKDYASVMAGSENGPVVKPGIAESSELIKRLEGSSLPQMPFGRQPLSTAQIDLIRLWIDQGALNN